MASFWNPLIPFLRESWKMIFVAKNTTSYLLSIWHMSGNQLPESIASVQTLEIFKGGGEGWGEVLWRPLTLEQCRKSFACPLTIPINEPHMYLLNSHNVTMLLSGSCTYWEKKILHGNIFCTQKIYFGAKVTEISYCKLLPQFSWAIIENLERYSFVYVMVSLWDQLIPSQ